MRRPILCLVLALAAAPASANGLPRTGPTAQPGASTGRVEAAAAKAQVDHDAFQSRILAAERRASASICVGCLASETAGPAARPAARARVAHAQVPAEPIPAPGASGDAVQ